MWKFVNIWSVHDQIWLMSTKLSQRGKADEVTYQWERINTNDLDKTYVNISWYVELLNIVLGRVKREKKSSTMAY